MSLCILVYCLIQAEGTKHNQSRKILDFIPRRGPTAFETFYSVMLESSNMYIADILHPELSGSHPHVGGGGERGYAPVHNQEFLPDCKSPSMLVMSKIIDTVNMLYV